jgi:hypothetical protein
VRSVATAIAVDPEGGRGEALSTALLLAGHAERERLHLAAPEARLRRFDFDRAQPCDRGHDHAGTTDA